MIDQLKLHCDKKQRVQLTRRVSKGNTKISNGYILGFSDDLLLLHASDDFKIDGYEIIPIAQIKKVRFNKSDEYFDKMMKWEKEFEKVGISYVVDLTNWKSAFESLKQKSLNVIVQCEQPELGIFVMGKIEKAEKNIIKVFDFDTEGYFDQSPTLIKYKYMTRLAFDTQYLNVFSKYTRQRNVQKK